jgi:hypothetical protein
MCQNSLNYFDNLLPDNEVIRFKIRIRFGRTPSPANTRYCVKNSCAGMTFMV